MASTIRRLAAIVAADIAGYSRLIGADEVGTVEALRGHRAAADPLIAQRGGRIVKTTGDGVLIEFGSVVGAVECALAVNPNAAHSWLVRGNIHALRNQPEAAIEAIERARHLSPFDPYYFFYVGTIAIAHLAARRFEKAIEWAVCALHDQPRLVTAMRVKIVANAHLGRFDEARAELGRMLAADPKLTISGFREAHFLAPEGLELYVAGLRLAGLPEE
jgi:tetratricopeptide (TPR) repeat protein